MGSVFLIGAGPGDPDLLTLRAARILASADVVIYDRLVPPAILDLASPAAELVYAGKHEGEQEATQAWIHEELVRHARAGRVVVRLKGGDPFVFGRGGEEVLALWERGIEAEVVPGVSSALAAPALAGIPVTFRGVSRSFAVVTGHCRSAEETDWAAYARLDTLIILMGVSRRETIAHALIETGRRAAEPVAFIERCSTPEERVIEATLGEVARGRVGVETPAVFVVGQVVALRRRIREAEPALAEA